jgi:hypothetical protein
VLHRLPKHIAALVISVAFELAKTEEGYLRAVFPAGFAVPELDRFDHAAVAREIDRASCAAGRNAIANDEFLVGAVMKMNDDALEENFAAFDAQLNGAETAIVLADVNAVVVLAPVNVGVAEKNLALRLSADGGECECEYKCNGSKSNSFEHVSSAVFP